MMSLQPQIHAAPSNASSEIEVRAQAAFHSRADSGPPGRRIPEAFESRLVVWQRIEPFLPGRWDTRTWKCRLVTRQKFKTSAVRKRLAIPRHATPFASLADPRYLVEIEAIAAKE
jgi:hypothetical protein